MKVLIILSLLATATLCENTVRYSNAVITAKFYQLRDSAEVGGSEATESINHGSKVRIEFTVSQPSEDKYLQSMTYFFKNDDGSWKPMQVKYECREINLRKMCYQKNCPIADFKPPTMPENVKECVMASKAASELLQYMLLNSPEVRKNAQGLKQCIEEKGKEDKKMEEICFNKAIGDLEKAKEELQKKGYMLVALKNGEEAWVRQSA